MSLFDNLFGKGNKNTAYRITPRGEDDLDRRLNSGDPEMRILLALEQDASCSIEVLSRRAQLPARAAEQVVKRLAAKGLISPARESYR